MSTVRGRRPWPRLTGPRLGAALAVVSLVVCNVWTGCTVTPSNYKTLSLFFDGVPDPSQQQLLTDPKTGVALAGMLQSVHRPYFEQSCGECHRARVRMSKNDSTICLKCHEGTEREHEYMHGPVAAKACMWCHHPHESKHKHLLRDADRALCGQCHVPELLDASTVKEHADESRGCLECHTGHGGSRPFMLLDTARSPVEQVPAPDVKEGK